MSRVHLMPTELVHLLVAKARNDSQLWRLLIEREEEGERRHALAKEKGLSPDLDEDQLPAILRPSWHELIIDFLQRELKADAAKYETLSLTVGLRAELRKDLNLSF